MSSIRLAAPGNPVAGYGLMAAGSVPLVLLLPAAALRRRLGSDRGVLRKPGFWLAAAGIMFAVPAAGTLDGVLPLHFAARFNQPQIRLAYAGTAVLIAVASAAAAATPGRALLCGGLGIVVGISLASATGQPLFWLVALGLIGLGAGAAQTGATGVLLRAVPTERISTALVVWSQMGIVGYLIAPALGGQLVDRLGFGWLGLLPSIAGSAVLAVGLLTRSGSRVDRRPSQ